MAPCSHEYQGRGDPCKGFACADRSFLFLSLTRTGPGKSYECLSADRIGSLSKVILKQAGWDGFNPHFLRALAAQRLERSQGEHVSRQAGFWCPTSQVYCERYNPLPVSIVPVDFMRQQGDDQDDENLVVVAAPAPVALAPTARPSAPAPWCVVAAEALALLFRSSSVVWDGGGGRFLWSFAARGLSFLIRFPPRFLVNRVRSGFVVCFFGLV